MALTTAGLNEVANKLASAISSVADLVDIYIFDNTYVYTTPNEAVSNLTTGYVTDASSTVASSGNKVVLTSTPKEITIPNGDYVKYYAIVSKNTSYAGVPFVVNTTVSSPTAGTFYQYGGKFVLTLFEFEVN